MLECNIKRLSQADCMQKNGTRGQDVSKYLIPMIRSTKAASHAYSLMALIPKMTCESFFALWVSEVLQHSIPVCKPKVWTDESPFHDHAQSHWRPENTKSRPTSAFTLWEMQCKIVWPAMSNGAPQDIYRSRTNAVYCWRESLISLMPLTIVHLCHSCTWHS